ncbi:hypothetical protein BH18ACI5_BH18ACI5_10070 [soil metagenome]
MRSRTRWAAPVVDAKKPIATADDGELRKRQYKNGADLVSGLD